MRVVDSHLHLWDPTVLHYSWLAGALDARYATAELLAAPIADAAEQIAVFVQAAAVEEQALDEVRWVDSIAPATGVVGIVADARLHRPQGLGDHLDALAEFDRVVGVRHLLQGEPDGFTRTDVFIAGARELADRGLTFDACVRAHQIPDVIALADAVPGLPIVLDHLGKPALGTAAESLRPAADWARDLRRLAEHTNVHVKLSGLPAEADGVIDAARMVPFLDAAAEVFGEDRLMWGSDWPVSSVDTGDAAGDRYVSGGRDAWFRTVRDWAVARGLDTDRVFWSNALAFYRIH